MPIQPPINKQTLSLDPVDQQHPERYVIIDNYWFEPANIQTYIIEQIRKVPLKEVVNPYNNQPLLTSSPQIDDLLNHQLQDCRLFCQALKYHLGRFNPVSNLVDLCKKDPQLVQRALNIIASGIITDKMLKKYQAIYHAMDSYLNSYQTLYQYLQAHKPVWAPFIIQKAYLNTVLSLKQNGVDIELAPGYYYYPAIHQRYVIVESTCHDLSQIHETDIWVQTPDGHYDHNSLSTYVDQLASDHISRIYDIFIYDPETGGYYSTYHCKIYEYGSDEVPCMLYQVESVNTAVANEILLQRENA